MMKLFLAVFLFALPALAGGPKTQGPEPGQEAPAFSLQAQDGSTHSLAQYKGKVVVLEWTNPECPFVKRHYQAATMKTLADKYKGKEVVWLAINSSNFATVETNKQFVEEQKLTYAVLDDHKGDVGHAYGARTTPDMYVVDPEGKIAYRGAIDNDPHNDKAADSKVNYVDESVPAVLGKTPVKNPKTEPYGCSVKYGT